MDRKKYIRKVALVVGLLFVPSLLFYLFLFTGVHRVKRLPFFGPRDITEVTFRGKTLMDTLYYEIPAFRIQLPQGDTLSHLGMEGQLWVAHYLPMGSLAESGKSIPKEIVYAALQALKADSGVRFLSLFQAGDSLELPAPRSFSEGFEGLSHRWVYGIGPSDTLGLLGQQYLFPEWTFTSAPPDPLSLVLIDKERRIRGYYNPLKAADVNRMKEDVVVLRREYTRDFRTHRHFDYNKKLEQRPQ